jgi:transcriptional regulator
VSSEWLEKLQRAIVAFEIPITRLEGKRKLSQNRPEADQCGVLAGLRSTGQPGDLELAELMERVLGLPTG